MSPSDKKKSSVASDSKEDNESLGSLKIPRSNQSSAEIPSSSKTDLTTPEDGTVTNIPLYTAKISTLKCSINDQMKTFDPGEDCNNDKTQNRLSGYSLSSFPLKNSNKLAKNHKNYKAGSKINKLADMLAKRSQNLVEVTQNTTSGAIADIISAPKEDVSVKVGDIQEVDEKFMDVFSEKTVKEQLVENSVNESQIKSLPNESNVNLQSETNAKCCSDVSELVSKIQTSSSESNALAENLIKLETDDSTKTKKEVKKTLRNVELSLILPGKKRRSSPRCKKPLVNHEIIKDYQVQPNYESKSISKTVKIEEFVDAAGLTENEIVSGSVGNSDKLKMVKRKSKRLVETSTQTTRTDFVNVGDSSKFDTELDAVSDKETIMYACLFCNETFTSGNLCKDHEKSHSQKKTKQMTKCQFCSKKLPSLFELKSHCIKSHPNKYVYCMKCDERFCEKSQLCSHNKLVHFAKSKESPLNTSQNQESVSNKEKRKEEGEEVRKSCDKKQNKQIPAKTDLKVDVSFDSFVKKSSTSPRFVQKTSPRDNKTEEQILEMEMLFYSHLSGNIKENLTNHLDGKIDKNGNPIRSDLSNESSESNQPKLKSANLLSVVSVNNAGAPSDVISRAPSPYQTRSKTPNPLPPTAKKFKKLPNWQQKFWEKYNFPTNYRYEHRFWDKNYLNTEKSAFYLKDLSCLDIKTQLTMRENIKKLESIKNNEEGCKSDKLSFPEYLSLVPRVYEARPQQSQEESMESPRKRNQPQKEDKKNPQNQTNKSKRKTSTDQSTGKMNPPEKNSSDGMKMMTRRQSVIELGKNLDESSRRRKGSLDVTGTQKMTLRRQTSLDNLQRPSDVTTKIEQSRESIDNETEETQASPSAGLAEISGEWVRPRSYLCGTCCAKFTNLWELEDHKWVTHPNVWCTHYEFEDDKIDKLFQRNDSDDPSLSNLKLTDLYKRYLLPYGSLKTAKLVPNINFPEQCTKCKKNCMSSSEMHKHMLDCGGDTTWFLTMYSSPMTIKRKWRPFGSRRRKQIGRRMLKRNIPNTSNMRPYHYQHRIRTKPGDVETIQKMLANLPEKRVRRAINFDEIKTRSQATIHSNRLLRKRFKVSFGTNFMRLKALKQQQQQRQAKSVKKETSSKSATDTSSENTPTGSPKRKSKAKENAQKPEVLAPENQDSETGEKSPKSKKESSKQSKKKSSSSSKGTTKKGIKSSKSPKKPITRSNSTGSFDTQKEINREKRKKESPETVGRLENSSTDSANKKKDQKSKNSQKKSKSKQEIDAETSLPPKVTGEQSCSMKKTKTENEDNSSVVSQAANAKESNEIKNKGKLTKKNILRLKSSDKEKTDLIKRIQKTLKNSKRILENRENKDKMEMRRSLRIKTLHLIESKDDASVSEKADDNEFLPTDNGKIDDVDSEKKKGSKCGKETDTDNYDCGDSESKPDVRLLVKAAERTEPAVVLVDVRLQVGNKHSMKECTSESAENRFCSLSEEVLHIGEVESKVDIKEEATPGKPADELISNRDLSEMPVLDKEVPVCGMKITRKSESDIPVLMPYANEDESVVKEKKFGKRKSSSFGKSSKKRRDSWDTFNGLDVNVTQNEKDSPIKAEEDKIDGGGSSKKRKRSLELNESEKAEIKLPKTPKKYFLGICPNEIDKGGYSKDESGSDSEPLISLVNNQKSKEKDVTSAAPEENAIEIGNKASSSPKKAPECEVETPVTEKCKFPDVRIVITDPVPEIIEKASGDEFSMKKTVKKPCKGLKMTVKLKEPVPKIVEDSAVISEDRVSTDARTEVISQEEEKRVKTERRSRRVSKEIKLTNEFVIDDPLILVDELWSDLDSDSDGSRKKSKKSKKKTNKRKVRDEERKENSVNLEELLRNFGESKNITAKNQKKRRERVVVTWEDKRKFWKNRIGPKETSGRRLSLRLFRFHRVLKNFGNRGRRLFGAQGCVLVKREVDVEVKPEMPALPFLTTEIKENPVQIIQCGAQKTRKKARKSESKYSSSMNFKISLPLQSINNLSVLNNNHLTEVIVEVPARKDSELDVPGKDETSETEPTPQKEEEVIESGDAKAKPRRSDVIDKIFYCEICKTYYYSSSQLKIHKLSNRHKLKESELNEVKEHPVERETEEVANCEPMLENIDPEKLNEDTSEMPILEGPFLENPFVRLGMNVADQPPKRSPPRTNPFGFTEECLKDIQKAIGCTDEEMLILTLLGEDTIELENDILDLDTLKPSIKYEKQEERESGNGLFKMDLKKRITSALTRLVNKAVLNLLQKYDNTNSTGISKEALSFLIKFSKLNNSKNLVELNDLLKREMEGESSNRSEEPGLAGNFECTICGSRFLKESLRESHVLRAHGCREDSSNEKEEHYKCLCSICGNRFQRDAGSIGSQKANVRKSPEDLSSAVVKEEEKRDQNAPYKYFCSTCGSRFQKESTWECHIKRSHKAKGKKSAEEVQTTYDDDWSSTWTYDINDELSGAVETPQFLCSDCGINFISPQEVLEHQKIEHSMEKAELSESGPLQSATIGSSDEIFKGRRMARRSSKHLTKAELDQQRIMANNELRKLDRKICQNKPKSNKIKWGMDALKFTVEKENKLSPEMEEKEVSIDDTFKPAVDPKNIDIIPKLNLSTTNNIPEFKVVQKNSCINRFQRILDNKLKRKKNLTKEEEEEEEVNLEKEFVEPIEVVQKDRKRKSNRCSSKKDEDRKVFDVYDFNDSESEPEPVAFSHVKKTGPSVSPTKLKLVKVKDVSDNETAKNKADSTTKDPDTEDYDSEDSLPLAMVKKTRTDEEEEMRAGDQSEKSEGILEQVEYLIEQLEHETSQPKEKEAVVEEEEDEEGDGEQEEKEEEEEEEEEEKNSTKKQAESENEEESIDSQPETFRISLESKFLQLENVRKKSEAVEFEMQDSISADSVDKPEMKIASVADSSQGVSDEEDSLPLVLMSKKFEESVYKKDPEIFPERNPLNDEKLDGTLRVTLENLPILSNHEEEQKSEKSYETLNGNVIYQRNDSMSGFESDLSDYGDFDAEKRDHFNDSDESLIKEVTEGEDVVIVCSKKEEDESGRKKSRESPKRRKENIEPTPRKKKILPLLSVTLEENNFRKSESPKVKKEVIVRKIWNRRRFAEDTQDENSGHSGMSRENDDYMENWLNDDSHSEIDKEIIMKKIWNKKRLDSDEGPAKKVPENEMKINQTEVSDEVVIKCGPKAKTQSKKKKKNRNSTKESSKEKIMRKIWSGKCTFQTKAALKTYDSDILPKDAEALETRVKKRGRPASCMRKNKTVGDKSDEDDLDSLLEEIEREEVEKAIRLEFLQLRRSDKANVEVTKESGSKTVGLFAETCLRQGRELTDRRRRRIRKNIKHPRKNLLKRRKFAKKPVVRSPEDEMVDGGGMESSDVSAGIRAFDLDSTKMKNRKHKKHRHKHHHHKHKHKKSKHRKYVMGKHKMRHSGLNCTEEKVEELKNFSLLEKMCQDIPSQIEKQKRFASELDRKLDEILMSTSSSFETKIGKDDDVYYENPTGDQDRKTGENVYDFVEDESDFAVEAKDTRRN